MPKFQLVAVGLVLLSGAVSTAQTGQITIAITPSSASLSAGGSTPFQASVRGTKVPGVTWSILPAIGTLGVSSATSTWDATSQTPISTVNGIYTAPSTITSPQAVTLVARSLVNPAMTSSATIYLASSTVGIAVTPSSVSLAASQSAVFQASIGGTLNTSVNWSLNPPIGTITNGVYTAPAAISTLQTILVTAASLADPSKTAQSSITLRPSLPMSIRVSPAQITLGASATQQFTATIQGGTAAVVWSINPNVGSISPSGLYTAPAALSAQQAVTIQAAISTDPTRAASATVTLAAPTPPPPPPPIQLPVEVIGLDGTTVTVPFNILSGSNLSGALTLSMSIHGLRFETQASVEVNNSGWHAISDSTVTLSGNATAYGGIGGGFSTLKMAMSVPQGALTQGTNTISFRFNATDGRVSGFRVLSFNFVDANSNSLLSPAAFVYEDPDAWQPPSSQASDIAAGRTLWYTAPITRPTPNGPVSIQAHCTDCHTQDGRDLKYFNYSNNSIRTRAMFHGLTAQQGDQIASYIRTINVVNPGRPWNPPYQPGPGLDSQPVIEWAAGAGLDAVLDNDSQILTQQFPNGIQDSFFADTAHINFRQMGVPFQFPDWNQWLPGTHPMDAFGTTFTTSQYLSLYQTIRSGLVVLNPASYVAQQANFDNWKTAYYGIYVTLGTPVWNNGALWTPSMVDAMYSLAQWGQVKNWELMNEFQLEGFAQNIFGSGPQVNPRAWYSGHTFTVSPHLLKMPHVDGVSGAVGLRNGSYPTYVYLSHVWYHLAIILNDSNGQQHDHDPIDWGYTYGFVLDMGTLGPNTHDGALLAMFMGKAVQIMNNGFGPEQGYEGWDPLVAGLNWMFIPPANQVEWPSVTPSQQAALMTGILRGWLAEVQQFTPQQFYTGGWASPTVNPVPLGNPDGAFGDWVWYVIPRFKYFGVDPTLVGQLAAWAQTVWPNANWTADLNATCSAPSAVDGTQPCSQ
jgi:hypothetical protein